MEQRIPKIIHYCWFGGNPKPELVLKCIESWKKYCPDYKIVEWNEENFDIHSNPHVEQAYRMKKWAFVADFVRLFALTTCGGIYLDTDMEVLRCLDPFLTHECFAGFEVNDSIATGIIGSTKDNEIIQAFFEYCSDNSFFLDGGELKITGPGVFTRILLENGLKLNGKKQTVCGCALYPKTAFYPTDLTWVFRHYSKESYCAHHYMESWGNGSDLNGRSLVRRIRLSLVHFGRNFVGTDRMYRLGQIIRALRR